MVTQSSSVRMKWSTPEEGDALAWIYDCLSVRELAPDAQHLAYHLVGTDRAFGLYFPEFFLSELKLLQHQVACLRRLFLASRAYLIADDAIRDLDRTQHIRQLLADACPRFRNECLEATKAFGLHGHEALQLLMRRERLAEWAYQRNRAASPTLASTCLRCSLWYLAFDVLSDHLGRAVVRPLRRGFSEALFLLQLADDAADLLDDLQSEQHRNLLTAGTHNPSDLFAQLSVRQISGYALLAIHRLANQLSHRSSLPFRLRLWAREIVNMVAIPESFEVDWVTTQLFPVTLPEGFLPPYCNTVLPSLDLNSIVVHPMNGIVLSAESVNSFATRRALLKGDSVWR